jgi:hypothetical protein
METLTKIEASVQPSQIQQSQEIKLNTVEPTNTPPSPKLPKKRIFAICEFAFVTWVGWLDPVLGFWVSLAFLVWHLLTDKE